MWFRQLRTSHSRDIQLPTFGPSPQPIFPEFGGEGVKSAGTVTHTERAGEAR